MSTRRVHYVVRGRVQGVAFRASACQAAQRCGVTGFVRNRVDGAVEGHAQGASGAVEAFVGWLHEGPPWARVEDVEVEELAPVPGDSDFVVRR